MRCPTHLCIGQEGPPVAISQHLSAEDIVLSAHRSHGHYLAKGGNLPKMIAELYGKVTGCARGKGGSQHLIDLDCGFFGSAPILASTISVGVGVAWASKRRKENKLTVIYFGDGATEEGAFHEAMNFAGVQGIPVLFVCENNLYSVHSDLSIRQPKGRSIWEIGQCHGVEGYYADGNDIVSAYGEAKAAVSFVHENKRPAIIEFSTYRWKEHCGPNDDDQLGYRSPFEIDHWKKLDPIPRFTSHLMQMGMITEIELKAMKTEIQQEIKASFEFAEASEFPTPSEASGHVFPLSHLNWC